MRCRAMITGGMMLIPLVGVGPASAQNGWITAARMSIVEYRVAAGYGPERFNGWAIGLKGGRQLSGRVTVYLSGQGVMLRAAAGDLDRRMGELEAGVELRAGAWWGLYGGLVQRAVASDASRQRWRFVRIGFEARPAFTGEYLHAIARLGTIPVASVSGLAAASFALDAAVGLEYDHNGVSFGVVYGLERFGFPPNNGVRRAEQLSTFTLRGGMRWPRR